MRLKIANGVLNANMTIKFKLFIFQGLRSVCTLFLDTEETEDDCLFTYWKLFQNSGFTPDVPFTNGLTYEDFRNGHYLVVFDLSTSSRCNSSNLIPGNVKIRKLKSYVQMLFNMVKCKRNQLVKYF